VEACENNVILMKVLKTAVLLAGGKSSRMGFEKALAEICGKKMIEWVIDALRGTINFVVATSEKNAPKTKAYCMRKRYEIIETPGRGYHEDLRFIQQRIEQPAFISVSCDIPFLRSEHVNALIDAYKRTKKSITGVVPLSMLPKGFSPSHIFELSAKKYVAFGLNVVSKDEDEGAVLVFEDALLGVNVNTKAELKLANDLMRISGRCRMGKNGDRFAAENRSDVVS